MKKPITIVLILLVVLASIFPIIFAVHSWFLVKDPDVTYKEFPIELTYEVNGRTVTIDEIYIVEYSGHNAMTGYGWSGYIQSTGEQGIILYEEDNLKIICELGDADYYIGKYGRYEDDIVVPHVYAQIEKRTFIFFKKKEYYVLTENELYEQYGIKLTTWTTAEPLNNYLVN